jgi:hypothetical protein
MKNKIRRILQKLEEKEFLNWSACADSPQKSEYFSFSFKDEKYTIHKIFENIYYAAEINDEVIEYYFYSKTNNCNFELVYDSLDKQFIIQSINQSILDIFSKQIFKKSGINYYFKVPYKKISFQINNKNIIFNEIKLIRDNTPNDYSDNKKWVYFAIGGKDKGLIDTDYILNKIDFLKTEDIIEERHGFTFFICTQQIPELVKILAKDWAIYQVYTNVE